LVESEFFTERKKRKKRERPVLEKKNETFGLEFIP